MVVVRLAVEEDLDVLGVEAELPDRFEDEGGFAGVRMRGAEVDLIDVQCEACHGPASNHARDGSYRASAIQSYVKCHTPNDDPDFDFATDWPKIAH